MIHISRFVSHTQLFVDPKNKTQHPETNLYPDGIYVNVNGVKGHFITKEIESNQTRPEIQHPYDAQKPFHQNRNLNSMLQSSNYYQYHKDFSIVTTAFANICLTVSILTDTDNDYTPFFNSTTSTKTTTTRPSIKPSASSRRVKDLTNTMREKEPHSFRNESRSNLPSFSIKQDDLSSVIDTKLNDASPEFPDIIEHGGVDYVEVLDEKNQWKPKLIFENKTETTSAAPSVIMRIVPKKTDVELFNIEAAPFKKGKLKIPHERRTKKSMRLSLDIG